MIRVIDGKRYDTEKAMRIYEWWNGCFQSDFNHRTKELYRTKNGAWFFFHVGGAMTDMGVSVGNNGRGGSETIEPVTDDDAYGFLESHSKDEKAVKAIDIYFADRVVDA